MSTLNPWLLWGLGGRVGAAQTTVADGTLKDDLREILDERGETVVYRPRAGGSRTILALVNRDPPETLAGADGKLPVATITVVNDATDGIASTELVKHGDQVEIAVHQGGDRQARAIGELSHELEHALVLEVR